MLPHVPRQAAPCTPRVPGWLPPELPQHAAGRLDGVCTLVECRLDLGQREFAESAEDDQERDQADDQLINRNGENAWHLLACGADCRHNLHCRNLSGQWSGDVCSSWTGALYAYGPAHNAVDHAPKTKGTTKPISARASARAKPRSMFWRITP